VSAILDRLGVSGDNPGAWAGAPMETAGRRVASFDPTTGEELGAVLLADRSHYETVVGRTHEAFKSWRMVPAPKRGEIVRQMGEALRVHKDDLGALVTLEVGKILSEGLGGPGKHRHGRLLCRSVAAALRADDALGTQPPPHV
jgi:aldehyde dehydrogenase (NAD+)